MSQNSKDTGYFLPLSYNDNKIVLLVRDPECLYAYWDVSNDKKEQFIRQFGEYSWNNSYPVIRLRNVTKNTMRYITVNDFASNWFIDVHEPNCTFSADFGRVVNQGSFVEFSSSNNVHTPKDKPSTKTIPVYFANHKDLRTMKKTKVNLDLGKYDYTTVNPRSGLSSAAISGISSDGLIK